jgi:Domain of unknown function (DUF6249)
MSDLFPLLLPLGLTDLVPLLVPLGAFAMVAAIAVAGSHFRYQRQKLHYDTIRAAIEKGQPLPEGLMKLPSGNSQATSPNDFRKGLILCAVGGGLWVGRDYGIPEFVAAIVGFIGVALLLNALLKTITGGSSPKDSPPLNDPPPNS